MTDPSTNQPTYKPDNRKDSLSIKKEKNRKPFNINKHIYLKEKISFTKREKKTLNHFFIMLDR